MSDPHDIDRLTAADEGERAAMVREVERLRDLVRHQRGALYDAGLVTDEEYAALAADTGAVARLEGYDRLRARIAELERHEASLHKHAAAAVGAHRAGIVAWLREVAETWSKLGAANINKGAYEHAATCGAKAHAFTTAADKVERGDYPVPDLYADPREEEIARLRADIAESAATLLNERGEGPAPGEGWAWNPHACYWYDTQGMVVFRAGSGTSWWWDTTPRSHNNTPERGPHSTARAAMKAANAAKDPK